MTGRATSAMLFAAGLGLRMRPLSEDRPKALVPVAGRTLLDHALSLVEAAGVGRIVVNTHYRAGMIASHLAGRDIHISHEPRLLDTGGGLKAALPYLGDPVITLNTDAVWAGANPISTLLANWRAGDEALLLLTRGEGRDFAMDGRGALGRGGGWTYTGAQILRAPPVAAVAGSRFSLNLVWDRLIAAGRLRGVAHDGAWCDVGTPTDVARAESMLAGHG